MTEMSVTELWENIERYYDPRKIERQKLFYRVFKDVIEKVHNGVQFKPEDTEYWEYLKGYRESWRAVPITDRALSQLKAKFRSAMKLYESVKRDGMKNPLVMKECKGKRFLHTGQRRLVILHVLGEKTAMVDA